MRIIIFSHPRSCSTYLQDLISKKLNLENWGEMVGPVGKDRKKYKTPPALMHLQETDLSKYDNYVTKLLTLQLYGNNFNLESIEWDKIDYVFITERQNLTDQICSLWYMQMKHKDVNRIDITSHQFKNALVSLQIFFSAKEFLLKNSNAKIIPYELFQEQPQSYVEELNKITNFNFTTDDCTFIDNKKEYSLLIENYSEIDNIVRALVTEPADVADSKSAAP